MMLFIQKIKTFQFFIYRWWPRCRQSRFWNSSFGIREGLCRWSNGLQSLLIFFFFFIVAFYFRMQLHFSDYILIYTKDCTQIYFHGTSEGFLNHSSSVFLSRFPRSLSSNRFLRCLVECDAARIAEGLKKTSNV